MNDDIFIIGALQLIPVAISATIASSRFSSKTLLAAVSAAIIGLIAFAIYYAQTHDGESSTGASFAAFFLGFLFFGIQIGTGGVWVFKALKKKFRDHP